MAEVEFFLGFSSAREYLAFVRLREAALRSACRILWRAVLPSLLPVSVIPLAGHADEARVRYRAKDVADWARFCGLPPLRPRETCAAELALRVVAALGQDPATAKCLASIYAAAFVAGAECENPEVLGAVLDSSGLESGPLLAAACGESTEHALRANTSLLLARGGFETPAMFVGDDMYVGHERVPLVEWALQRAADRRLVMPGDHRAS